jgi:ATP phosphoribosyltransferase regulatory subunit
MAMKNHWLLPEGIEEMLPPQAARLEELCRQTIDLYKSWGYQLVMPPLIEFLESLLTGTGEDLDLKTFKLTDQLSGRLMGVRADTTPQVARIDAHNLKRDVPSRLCYLGTVLHTRPENHGGTRSPLQVGAELYGHQGKESDAEILCLMLETLKIAGVNNVHVDLGHVGIYQGLVKQAGLSGAQETVLFDVLQRKAGSELQELIKTWSVPEKTGNMFMFLINANGDASVFREAGRHLATANAKVKNCLKELQSVAELVKKRIPDAPLYFDLAELRGYHYHTGIVFAAYVPGTGQGIAFGGRYDGIGLAFGRARPATGFSTDIKTLLALSSLTYKEQQGIFAPCKNDPVLLKMIDKLRDKGEVVITELPGQKGNAKDMGCDRKLVRKAGTWKVVKL